MSAAQQIVVGDGCRIGYHHHTIDASQPTIVLSNSLGTTFDMWNPQYEALKHQFNVLRYDTRGHGRSEVFAGNYSLDRLGRDVIDLMDALALEKVHFCGLSLGGMVGQWLAARFPHRIDRLVLANTSAFIGPPEFWQQRISLVERQGLLGFSQAIIERWFTPQFIHSETETVESLREMFSSLDPSGYAACCAAIRDMDLRPIAPLNRLPTLIIAGSEDQATPLSNARFLNDANPHSELAILPAAHLSNLECVEAFNTHLLAAFKRH